MSDWLNIIESINGKYISARNRFDIRVDSRWPEIGCKNWQNNYSIRKTNKEYDL